MKNILGIALGVLALGLIVIATSATGTGWEGAPTASGRLVGLRSPAAGEIVESQVATSARPVLVNCGAGQQALVRQREVNGEAVAQVDCVGEPDTAVYAAREARAYSASQVVPATVAYERPTRRASYAPQVTRQNGRSMKKTLMVIGGSTAAGAGVGGLIGGKKGALIGAALGGGASTIFEASKR